MAETSWMEIMGWITASPYRPLVLITLAQNNGQPLDEMNLASRSGLMHQRMTGEVVETALVLKHVTDLGEGGYIERSPDGFRWQLTDLGTLVSRQWATENIDPQETGPLDQPAVRAWRERVIATMDKDAALARAAGIDQGEWLMTQSQRMVELHVLNRVLGEQELPKWLVELQGGPPQETDDGA